MSYNDKLYNIIQGFFYFSIPLLLILIGFQLSKTLSIKQYFSFILITGNIISLLYISIAIYKIGFDAFLSPYTKVRFLLGSGSPACVLSLVVSLFSDKFGLGFFKKKWRRYLSIIINLVAIYLFASRTYWVMLFIFLILFSIKTIKSDKLFILIFLSIGLLFLYFNVLSSEKGLSFSNSITFKLTHSIKEISLENFKSRKDITVNYRGYEAYRSWMSYKEGSPLKLVFGHGLGKLIDLKTEVFLAGKFWKEVPVIHNGFFFILVKTGALGLVFNLLMFFFFMSIGLRRYSSTIREQQFIGVFILACGASLFMTNYVVCGLFNFEMSILLITTGFIISKHYIHTLQGFEKSASIS